MAGRFLKRFAADRRGAIAVVYALLTPVLVGAVGFTVDSGLIYTAQTRLQNAADAAALAGAARLGTNDVVSRAQELAAMNASGPILSAGDVEIGSWNQGTQSFTPGGPNPNAVRVTTRYAEQNGNAHRLAFGPFLGMETTDIEATAIALGGSQCEGDVLLYQNPGVMPTRTSIVTMGEICSSNCAAGYQPGTAGYLQTPEGHPIIRVDNHVDGPARIRANIIGGPGASMNFDIPSRGQFFVVLTSFTNTGYAPLSIRITFATPGRPGTATWANNIRRIQTYSETPICVSSTGGTGGGGGQRAAGRLVG